MKIHPIQGYIQTLYLVEYPHGLLLLDSGCRCDVDTVIDFIESELQRSRHELLTVMVTHMHPDHAGGAALFKQRCNSTIVSRFTERHWYQGFIGRVMYYTDVLLTLWVANKKRQPWRNILYPAHLYPDVHVSHRHPVPHFSDWCILATEGHTDRDISVLNTATNQVYVGDLMVKVKGRFIPPFPVFFPNRYRRSLTLINNLNVNQVLLAHGGIIDGDRIDYELLNQLAPKEPTTHYRAIKSKLKRLFNRQ